MNFIEREEISTVVTVFSLENSGFEPGRFKSSCLPYRFSLPISFLQLTSGDNRKYIMYRQKTFRKPVVQCKKLQRAIDLLQMLTHLK